MSDIDCYFDTEVIRITQKVVYDLSPCCYQSGEQFYCPSRRMKYAFLVNLLYTNFKNALKQRISFILQDVLSELIS